MARVAVLTFPMKGKNGVTTTCNMVEELNVPLGRINERFDDLRRKGFEPVGDIILNFVETEEYAI